MVSVKLGAVLVLLLVAGSAAFAGPTTSLAETATLSGYIVDADNGETLIAATVQIKDTQLGVITNKLGYFSMAGIKPGTYTFVFSFLGYEPQEEKITLKAGESRQVRIELKPEALKVDEITVEGDRYDDVRRISISRVNVPTQQLTNIRIGGEADIFRSIQYLPGVLASSQISSGLYIRGGTPDQTLVLLDGSTVYNPSHLFGFFSTFNPDAIKDVDLIKGGYPAEYGGRLSAVLDVQQKDGNHKETEGMFSLGLISSRVSLQGPVGNGSWFFGARRTYIDLLTSLLETEEDPLPSFFFYDINGKISQDFGQNDKVFLSGFTSEDNLTIDNNAGFEGTLGISNRAVSGRWTHLFSDNVFSTFNASWSRYRNSFATEAAGFETEVENIIQDFTVKGNLEWFTTESLTLKGGFEVSRFQLDYFQNFSGKADTTVDAGTENEGGLTYVSAADYVYSAFTQMNYDITQDFSMQLGLRGNYYDLRGIGKLDPRVAVRYQVNPALTVKGAFGIYHQYFRLASLPDFSFFDTWLPTDTTVNPSQAIQYVLGIETRPLWDLDVNVDVYYKDLNNISELNALATEGADVAEFFYNGNGESFGAELFIQKKAGRFTGWAGYAIGWVNVRFDNVNEGRWFSPKWDRRHDFKLVGQYKLSDTWDVGATFTFQTGQRYTSMSSRIESRLPGEFPGTPLTVPVDRYNLRLPPSHQLNINASWKTTIFDLPARLLIDIFNVYSRRDIWFRFYNTDGEVTEVEDVELLPILPTVALEVKF